MEKENVAKQQHFYFPSLTPLEFLPIGILWVQES